MSLEQFLKRGIQNPSKFPGTVVLSVKLDTVIDIGLDGGQSLGGDDLEEAIVAVTMEKLSLQRAARDNSSLDEVSVVESYQDGPTDISRDDRNFNAIPLPDVNALALQFCIELNSYLSIEQLRQVVDLNEKETDLQICHTGDVCDSNQLMLNALGKFGVTSYAAHDEPLNDLIYLAWSIAKAAKFAVKLAED